MAATLLDLVEFIGKFDGRDAVVVRSVELAYFHAQVFSDGVVVLSARPNRVVGDSFDERFESLIDRAIECDLSMDEVEEMISTGRLPPDEKWVWSDER